MDLGVFTMANGSKDDSTALVSSESMQLVVAYVAMPIQSLEQMVQTWHWMYAVKYEGYRHMGSTK